MPIDILLFREKSGGDLARVRESQKARGKEEKTVDEIVALDEQWRKDIYAWEQLKSAANNLSKQFGERKKKGESLDDLQVEIAKVKEEIAKAEAKKDASEEQLKKRLSLFGNIVHPSVPRSMNEEENRVERVHGECKRTGRELHHHELLYMIGGYSPEQGAAVAGHRGYFLRDVGVLLNQALINYGLAFLRSKGYIALQPPFFMKKDVMARTAQLEEFDEALYHVQGAGDDSFYLIATSEQPISAYHMGEWLAPDKLPKMYAGVSSCFRKEAGSYGKDAWGIFRVHQFEKVEQFVICSPDKSWEMHEEMIKIAEDFYKSLGFSYRVVNIVSGALNNAAAKKYDLEAWFPTLGVYRELVSCSNCTDYQARAMETRFGQTRNEREPQKLYCHMLNATLCATERTICCIMENYQTEEGVRVPEVLQPYMGGITMMKFVNEKPKHAEQVKAKQAKAEARAAEGKA